MLLLHVNIQPSSHFEPSHIYESKRTQKGDGVRQVTMLRATFKGGKNDENWVKNSYLPSQH